MMISLLRVLCRILILGSFRQQAFVRSVFNEFACQQKVLSVLITRRAVEHDSFNSIGAE